jgi:hypothetical protein
MPNQLRNQPNISTQRSSQSKFEEEDWVLMKGHTFLNKNNKLAKTYRGPFKVTKVHTNGIALIRTKTSKHDHLVNANLLVKYNKQ